MYEMAVLLGAVSSMLLSRMILLTDAVRDIKYTDTFAVRSQEVVLTISIKMGSALVLCAVR
jgi:hypothetical protein